MSPGPLRSEPASRWSCFLLTHPGPCGGTCVWHIASAHLMVAIIIPQPLDQLSKLHFSGVLVRCSQWGPPPQPRSDSDKAFPGYRPRSLPVPRPRQTFLAQTPGLHPGEEAISAPRGRAAMAERWEAPQKGVKEQRPSAARTSSLGFRVSGPIVELLLTSCL